MVGISEGVLLVYYRICCFDKIRVGEKREGESTGRCVGCFEQLQRVSVGHVRKAELPMDEKCMGEPTDDDCEMIIV